MSVASLSHTEALLLPPAPLRRPWRSPLKPGRLLFGLSTSGLCHAAAIVLLVWLPTAVLTTDATVSGRQSILTVAFADVPSVADPEVAAVDVQIDLIEVEMQEPDPSFAVTQQRPTLIEPCPVPVNRTDTRPPTPESAIAMLEPMVFSDTVTSVRHTPPRVTSQQPRIAIEPIRPVPRRRPARLPASIAMAVPARIGSVETTAAKPLDNPLPEYPIEALHRAIHGRVMLRVTVSPGGTVSGLEVAQTSGYRVFDEAAVDVVQRWQFEPARRYGQPVASTVLLPIRFLPR